jgi:GNAT superfamily N-acetyltransferase
MENSILGRSEQIADVAYRAVRPEDVPEMVDLFLTAVTDMLKRHNVALAPPPRQAMLAGYEHVRATGIFRLAELENRIVAIAGAVVRDDLWYLSAFWARPDLQRKGIGMPLLRQVFEAGVQSGAKTFFTWSSVDITAMAAYMKLGMLPGYEVLVFEGSPQRLPAIGAGYEAVPLEKKVAMEMDRAVRGTRREVDHDLWARQMLQGRQVLLNGNLAGYYYLNGGMIGPAAWREPRHAEAILTLACREAVALAPNIRLSVPGINHAAVRFAFESGLRLKSFAHLLTTAPFGRMEQYLPLGPSLF